MKKAMKKLTILATLFQAVIGTFDTIKPFNHMKKDNHASQMVTKLISNDASFPNVRNIKEIFDTSSIESTYCDGNGVSIPIKVDITTDNFPDETSWKLYDYDTDEVVLEGGSYENPYTLYTDTLSVCSDKCYKFTLLDSYGDGILGWGNIYKVSYNNTLVKEGDGKFGSSESTLLGGRCPSMHPSMLPSYTPSMSDVPSSNPTTPVPSYTPSTSSPPSLPPSSSPSAKRTHWWSADPKKILEGHIARVHSLCFNPDGMWLASGSQDNTIKLWKNGGGVVQTINEHTEDVESLDFNFDGTKLVSGSADKTVKLWDFNNNGTISHNNTFYGHTNVVRRVRFSSDGRFIASGSADSTIKIWSTNESGTLIHTLTGHIDVIHALSFSRDGKVLASGSADKTIKLWDIVNGWSLIRSYNEHTSLVHSLDFSPDGAHLASGFGDGTIRIWNFENSTLWPVRTLQDNIYLPVRAIKYSPDGQYLASGSDVNNIRLWNRNDDYYLMQTLQGHTDVIRSIDFSRDGENIASGSYDTTIHIWGFACSPGNYGTHPQCQPCPSGTYQPAPDKQNKDSCIPCAAGTFQSEPGAIQCETCTLGTFQPFKGQTKCDKCRVGGYCANSAVADSCDGGFTACPIGTFNNVAGAFDEKSCIQCPPGTFSDNKTALDVCFECPKGTYQDKKGELGCAVCNSTTYQNQTGQSNCKNCPPGTYPDPSRSSCLNCPKGTYSNTGDMECKACDPGRVQDRTGQSTCEICPSGTHPDQSNVTCVQCTYRLGSEEGSENCPFCANGFYLKEANVKPEDLIKDPAKFCLACPLNVICDKNTTIETIKGAPGFWRDSNQTETFYECNHITGVCLGGTSCSRGHSGVRCEVCEDKNKYFDSSKGECTKCPSFARFCYVGLVVGIYFLFLIMKKIMHQYSRVEIFFTKISYLLATIGLQAKIKILVSFCQVVVTFQPIYGVRMHSAFIWWFNIFDIFNFGLAETFGIPFSCFGSIKARLLIGAGSPYALAILLVSGVFIYTIVINRLRLKRNDNLAEFPTLSLTTILSRSLHGVIILFYLVLPSVSRRIFDARTCKSFDSHDSKNELSSYLIADWSIKCENGNSDYGSITRVFWALFTIWPVTIPIVALGLLLFIRPSVRSSSITPLTQACRFLWSDYDQRMMFWEVFDMIRKISLTGLIIFIDTEEGSQKILRLIIATGICIFYGTILSRARPYKSKDNLELAILSNLLLTCCFLVGIIIHQCNGEEGGENNTCMNLFGLSGSYEATLLAMILTATMLLSFVIFIFIQSINEFKTQTICLVSTNNAPNLGMPHGCRYHLFVSHVWSSGQDKVHKIVRMLKLYLQGVKIWLDVDVLENLNDLEESIAESAHFVLFYSKGFFESCNCRREVVKATDLDKPITVIFEPDDVAVDMIVQMKKEFRKCWPQELSPDLFENYIFEQNPIMWISNGLQFSLESIKLLAGRLLKKLPYYQKNAALLSAGLNIDGEIKSMEVSSPLDILYCRTNAEAYDVALKLVEECKGDIKVRAINLSSNCLRNDNREAVMLVYLNKSTFQDPGCALCRSIIDAIDDNIKVVLVHENDPNKGGCNFEEIMKKTPKELRENSYNIYSGNIAVNLYSFDDYQKTSLRLLLTKMGASPFGKHSIVNDVKHAGSKMIHVSSITKNHIKLLGSKMIFK